VSLASVLPVQHLIDRIVTMLSRVAPGDVVAIARQQFVQITRQPHGGVLTLSLLAALWSTSAGMTAIVGTLNQAYHITERRPWWRVRATAIALTLALTIVTLLAFALVMVGPTAAQQAADWLALGPLVGWTWNVVRWPAAFVLVVTAIGCIYHFAPDTRHEWVWITPGSVTATAIWLLISLAFKWYASHFADYQKTYGAIGDVMVALLWFYFHQSRHPDRRATGRDNRACVTRRSAGGCRRLKHSVLISSILSDWTGRHRYRLRRRDRSEDRGVLEEPFGFCG
jgi:membrane protein